MGAEVILRRTTIFRFIFVACSMILAPLAWAGQISEYTCKVQQFCKCASKAGCSSVDALLVSEPSETCLATTRTFVADSRNRRVHLLGDQLDLVLKEARPLFTDLDLYQAGQTEDRGLLNLSFDNEKTRTDFVLREMVRGDFTRHIWRMAEVCEAQ